METIDSNIEISRETKLPLYFKIVSILTIVGSAALIFVFISLIDIARIFHNIIGSKNIEMSAAREFRYIFELLVYYSGIGNCVFCILACALMLMRKKSGLLIYIVVQTTFVLITLSWIATDFRWSSMKIFIPFLISTVGFSLFYIGKRNYLGKIKTRLKEEF